MGPMTDTAEALANLLHEERRFPPSDAFAALTDSTGIEWDAPVTNS